MCVVLLVYNNFCVCILRVNTTLLIFSHYRKFWRPAAKMLKHAYNPHLILVLIVDPSILLQYQESSSSYAVITNVLLPLILTI